MRPAPRLLALISAPLLAARLAAQPLGTLRGVVYDSIVGAPLAGAEVWVEGSTRTGTTARDGTFRIDSLPPRSYTITFAHPSLDSLGLGAPFGGVAVRGGDTTYALLATPSMSGLARRLCPGDTAAGRGTLLGVVRDAAAGAALAGARVDVRWSEFDVSKRTSSAREHTRAATSDAGGRYVVCGVPDDVLVGVQATAAGSAGAPPRRTGLALVDVRGRVLTWYDVRFGVAPAAAASGGATLLLTIVDRAGLPIAGAQTRVGGQSDYRTASDDGRLRVAGLAAGPTTLEVRALGYEPAVASVALAEAREQATTVRLERGAIPLLETVRVTGAAHLSPAMVGYELRKRGGAGYFIERDEIERRQATRISQLLRRVPGLRFERTSPTDVTVSSARTSLGALGGSCPLGLVVDGQVVHVDLTESPPGDAVLAGPAARGGAGGGVTKSPIPTNPADLSRVRRQTIDDFVSPHAIAAIEVYPSMTGAPIQYGRFPCGVILVWTRAVDR